MKPRKRNAPKLRRSILRLRPNDIVVLHCPQIFSIPQKEHLRAWLTSAFAGQRCIVLDPGFELSVVHKVPG